MAEAAEGSGLQFVWGVGSGAVGFGTAGKCTVLS